RWLLTLSFGLIHGLGFAGVLQELGIAQKGVSAVVPLAAFNLGVEAGQIAIAAIALPIIWKLRERPSFVRIGVPACSLLVACAGAYWLFERTVIG
ncbi:MAG: HupE/UreJ family protein, partial [Verrucomicrobiaceae bacterium]|nr:HupE/UreJ family protein [Verrucomicrobiaceae bacterium]